MNKRKEVWFLIHFLPDHPHLNRLVTGVWTSYEGAKKAFDHFKKERPEFDYAISSCPIFEDGEGLS